MPDGSNHNQFIWCCRWMDFYWLMQLLKLYDVHTSWLVYIILISAQSTFFPDWTTCHIRGTTARTFYNSELLYLIKDTCQLPTGNMRSVSAMAACGLEWHLSFSFQRCHIIARLTYFCKTQVRNSKLVGNKLSTEVTIFLHASAF